MGNEAKCVVGFGNRPVEGKALLETSDLIFRSADAFRLKIAFAGITSAKAVNGALRLQTVDGLAVFEPGEDAEKWCEKILHPETRIEKLAVKTDAQVSLVGEFEAEVVAEPQARTRSLVRNKVTPESGVDIFTASSSKELVQLAELAKSLRGSAALWIVYPKGAKRLRRTT
jgi:hypothetical protein